MALPFSETERRALRASSPRVTHEAERCLLLFFVCVESWSGSCERKRKRMRHHRFFSFFSVPLSSFVFRFSFLLGGPHCPSSAYHASDIGTARSLGGLLEHFG